MGKRNRPSYRRLCSELGRAGVSGAAGPASACSAIDGGAVPDHSSMR